MSCRSHQQPCVDPRLLRAEADENVSVAPGAARPIASASAASAPEVSKIRPRSPRRESRAARAPSETARSRRPGCGSSTYGEMPQAVSATHRQRALRPGAHDQAAAIPWRRPAAPDRGERDGQRLGADRVGVRPAAGHRPGERGGHRDPRGQRAWRGEADDHPVRAHRGPARPAGRAAQARVVRLDDHPLPGPVLTRPRPRSPPPRRTPRGRGPTGSRARAAHRTAAPGPTRRCRPRARARRPGRSRRSAQASRRRRAVTRDGRHGQLHAMDPPVRGCRSTSRTRSGSRPRW